MKHRRRGRSVGRPRPTKWIGGAVLETVEKTADQTVAEITQLITDATSLQTQNDITILGGNVHLNIRRTATILVNSLGYIIAVQDTDIVGDLTEVLSSLGANGFIHANKNIMSFGCLPVPGLDGAAVSNEVLDVHIPLTTKRKLQRAREVLSFTVACDVSGIIVINITWRILVGL